MQNNPLVSIIMNCYNCEKYLKQTIESVLNQTYKNWEIIFWDNQSTDNSAKIVKSYNDDRIKYFYALNHTTLGEARNKALEKANGEFISFLDCDDLYLPTKIENTLKCFNNEEIGLAYTNGYILFDKKNKKQPFYITKQDSGYVFEKWLESYKIMIPSVMFRKVVLNDLDYWFDVRFNMIEEFDFFLRISKTWKVAYNDEKICIWRAHNNSLTWSKGELFEKENKIFLENLLINYPELKNKKYIKKFKAKIAYHTFYNQWKREGKINRKLLYPYFLIDKRMLIIYFLSFFGLKPFDKILTILGKNV